MSANTEDSLFTIYAAAVHNWTFYDHLSLLRENRLKILSNQSLSSETRDWLSQKIDKLKPL